MEIKVAIKVEEENESEITEEMPPGRITGQTKKGVDEATGAKIAETGEDIEVTIETRCTSTEETTTAGGAQKDSDAITLGATALVPRAEVHQSLINGAIQKAESGTDIKETAAGEFGMCIDMIKGITDGDSSITGIVESSISSKTILLHRAGSKFHMDLSGSQNKKDRINRIEDKSKDLGGNRAND